MLKSGCVVVAALAAVSLAACTSQKSEPVAPPEPRLLAGVDLDKAIVALGNEPFWNIDIDGQKAAYSDPELTTPVEGTVQGPVITGNVAEWRASLSNGTHAVLTIAGTDCSDGMSDRTYPLAARLQLGETTYTGCAASKAALDKAGESGRVE
ncbi:hypothetical protein [uncultured Brevundimonas sp.]|uniref:COG3650 family protein n=1 Tax=uncultured Brevundimonas sp. TaxID=213418 RepID=UPI002606703D|nr:hypothetical protein [uncultured Brevundimonas sp.]